MHILKIGVNYQIAPLAIREQLAFSDDEKEAAMLTLAKSDAILENVILSTCNRTEIFAVVESIDQGERAIIEFLRNWFNIPKEEFVEYIQVEIDEQAVKHAFKLAVGLDSLVLGETQILGQVRDAFLLAQQVQVTDKVFNELFKRVVTFAKRAHSHTVIGQQAVSISYVAVELSKKLFGNMNGKHAVIIGAGEMGELSLENLESSGISTITVVNRSIRNAQLLANRFQAHVAGMDQLEEVLTQADIVISSTGANEPILTKKQLARVQRQRRNRALFLIDIAVPRDIAANVDELANVFLYDIDDLQHVADENMEARKKAAVMIESQLVDELASFDNWVNMLDVVPLLQALQEKSHHIQERTLESMFNKIPDLDEREMKVVRKHTKSIINQLLQQPIKQAKLMSMSESSEDKKAMFINIFGLDDILKNEQVNNR